jgi:AGZA family xanthine/uracil permease-like MFS transporter
MLEKYFKLKENGATVGIEVMAGVATFLTAVYVLFVNPLVLSDAGMPRDALFTATALSIIVGTLLMAFFANMPLILAPGMGINAYFAYSIVLGQGYSWQEALTAVFIAGVVFVVLGAVGIRKILLEGFPEPLKHAMTVSLGLMIAGIGLKNSGVVVFGEFIRLGDVTHGSGLLALIGIFVTGVLMSLRWRAAILLGIIITTIIGCFTGVTNYSTLAETGALSLPPSIAPIAAQFSFDPARLLTMDFIAVVFALLVLDVFDSLGTFIGVFNHFPPEVRKHYEERIPRALMCDAAATVAGSLFGVSTVTTYVESSTGIQAGGKTGLTAAVIAVLMAVALFASPLFLMVPAAATAPALVVVGMLMLNCAGKVSWLDPTEGLPAVIMIMTTALTWSISDGLMFGWIGFMALKLFSGRFRELNGTVYCVGIFFVFRLIYL